MKKRLGSWSVSTLRRLLFARSDAPQLGFLTSGQPMLARRDVLAGMATVTASAAIAADNPDIRWGTIGKTLLVNYGGNTWKLNSAAFGPAAKINWDQNTVQSGHHIVMSGAIYPGLVERA